MAIFCIKPLIHLSREVVKKWDGNSSLVVLFYAVTASIIWPLPLPEQPLSLVLLEQPLVPLLTEDMCFFAGPYRSSGYSSDLE